MKAKIKCEGCGVDIIFEKKDIKKLTKQEQKNIDTYNKNIKKLLDKTHTFVTPFRRKKIVKPYYQGYAKDYLKSRLFNVIGSIKCPICESEQFLLRNR